MAPKISIFINDQEVSTEAGKNILQVCRENDVSIPTLCYLEGLSTVGACRLCLVEIEGTPKLLPACTTPAVANQKIRTHTEKINRYRKMIVELFFAERNHICSVCVANNHCELQQIGYEVGMDHVRFPYLFPTCELDASHEKYNMDHNRCIMCTRCVRVCDEVEGAHNWDVMGRGFESRIIADFNQAWGESITCTSCGKCIEVCPTGALWPKQAVLGKLDKKPAFISELVEKRGIKS